MNTARLKKLLIKHEGIELKPYRCPSGFLSIGIGRCLEKTGISSEEADFMFSNDIQRCERELRIAFPWFEFLTDSRQEVLVNMCFQMGITGLKKFKRMVSALEQYDYDLASKEMLDSKWGKKQTPARAVELSEIMKHGYYQL